MNELVELSKIVGALPLGAWIGCVLLAGFGLAAYAIHAVITIAKGGK